MPRGGAATSVEATLSRYEFEFARDEFIDKLSFIVDKGIQSGRLLPYSQCTRVDGPAIA